MAKGVIMSFSRKFCIPLLIFILLVTFFSITVFAASEREEDIKAHTGESITGDVNGDGKLTLSDILELQKHIANIAVISSLTKRNLKRIVHTICLRVACQRECAGISRVVCIWTSVSKDGEVG